MSLRPPSPDDRPMALRPVSERVTKADPELVYEIKLWRRFAVFLGSLLLGVFIFWDAMIPKIGSLRKSLITSIRTKTEAQKPVAVVRPAPAPLPPKKEVQPPTPKPAPPRPVVLDSLPALDLSQVEFPAFDQWPTKITLPSLPTIQEVATQSDGELHIYRSPHYEFRSRVPLGADVVREFSRVFEATYLAVSRLPLDLRPQPERTRVRFVAELFEDMDKYLEAGGMAGSAGCYNRAAKTILVPLDSLGVKVLPGGRTIVERGGDANSTLIHEITHQLMNAWLPRLPVWLTEGSAEYMEVPQYLHGRFEFAQIQNLLVDHFTRGDSRFALTMLRPSQLLLVEPKEWAIALAGDNSTARENYQSSLLLTFYFFHLDKTSEGLSPIFQYFRDVEKGTPHPIACEKHLVRGRTAEVFDSDVRSALRQIGLHLELTSRGGREWDSKSMTAQVSQTK